LWLCGNQTSFSPVFAGGVIFLLVLALSLSFTSHACFPAVLVHPQKIVSTFAFVGPVLTSLVVSVLILAHRIFFTLQASLQAVGHHETSVALAVTVTSPEGTIVVIVAIFALHNVCVVKVTVETIVGAVREHPISVRQTLSL